MMRSAVRLAVVLACVGFVGCGDDARDPSGATGLEVVVDANVGDGRLATDASIMARQIAVAPSGDLLLAGPTSVRRVDARTHRISTIPGTEIPSCADGPSGTIDCGGSVSVMAVAADRAGRIYFAIDGHIVRTGPEGGRVEYVAGRRGGCPDDVVFTGPADEVCFGVVVDLAVDGAGRLLIADGTAGSVVRLDPERRIVSLVARGISGTETECRDEDATAAHCFGYPTGVAVDSLGGVLIATAAPFVYRVDPATGRVRSIAGRAERCALAAPSGDGGPAHEACLRSVMDVAVDAEGTLYVADSARQSIRRIDAATGIVSTVESTTAERTIIPWSLAVGRDGGLHALAFGERFAGLEIRRYDDGRGPGRTLAGNGTYGFCGDGGPAEDACLGRPIDVAVAPDGAIYVADVASRRVRRVADGRITTFAGDGGLAPSAETCRDGVQATDTCLDAPAALAASREAVYVLEGYGLVSGFNRVRRVDRRGVIETVIGGCRVEGDPTTVPAADACLHVAAIAVDAEGDLWVGERSRVSRFDATAGRLVPVVAAPPECEGADGVRRPQCFDVRSLALDGAGNLYVGGDARVWRVAAGEGVATLLAGNGTVGGCGDGGPAVDACLTVGRVVADAAGNVFVGGGGAVRRLDAATGIVTTVVGRDDGTCFSEDPAVAAVGPGCAAVAAIDDAGRLLYPERSRFQVGRVLRFTP